MLIKHFKKHHQEPSPYPVMPGSAQPTPTSNMVGMQQTYVHPKSVSSPVEYNTQVHTVK